MPGFLRAALVACCLLMAGCAIHPLPENVTGVPTYLIVRQIRCETRQVIIESTLGWLASDKRVDAASRDIGAEFSNGRPMSQFGPGLFKGPVASIIQLFFDTGVVSFFELEMTEVNNVGAQLGLLKPFTNSKLAVGLNGSVNRQRVNDRTFTISDTFSGLVRLPESYCVGVDEGKPYNYVVAENHAYPVAGRIGVQPLVHDFINLTLFANLAGKKDNPAGPPTLVDALEFQTEISGTAAPTVTFSPLGTGLSVTDASITGTATRRDLHKITMGLAIAGPGIKLVGPVRQSLFTQPLISTTPPTTTGEQRAAEAVNQALTLKLFRPTITIAP